MADQNLYPGLLKRAFAEAARFDGSEAGITRLVTAFGAADTYVQSVVGTDLVNREACERDFAAAAGHAPETLGAMMVEAVAPFYRRLSGSGDIFAQLAAGGAAIVETANVFLPTEGEGLLPAGLEPNSYRVEFQPRLAWLVEDLGATGIYMDDLLIHRGSLRAGMMRRAPYHVVDIPRLGRQIAVCDQVGQATFVSREIFDPGLYAKCRKDILRSVPEITDVTFSSRANWRANIQALLNGEPSKKMSMRMLATSPPRRRSPLTIAMIAESAHLYFAKHGERPRQDRGLIEDGPCQGGTWAAVGVAIKLGLRGLKDCGYTSLSQVLDAEKIYANRLDVAMIVESARLHVEKYGKRPNRSNGHVESGPCLGTTWSAIDAALVRGLRGLKDCGYTSVAGLMDGEEIPDNSLTIAMITESARLHLATHGSRPIMENGPVESGPCFGTTWLAINAALNKGHRGLAGCGYTSLYNLLEVEKIGVVSWNVAMIAESARLHLAAHGERPIILSGSVENGPCKGTSWESIDHALRAGSRGLKDCGYDSLSRLLDGERIGDKLLTVDMIFDSARLYLAAHGERPNTNSGLVEAGLCKGTTWQAVNDALRSGYRGLKDCGYSSLSKLLDSRGFPSLPNQPRAIPVSNAGNAASP